VISDKIFTMDISTEMFVFDSYKKLDINFFTIELIFNQTKYATL